MTSAVHDHVVYALRHGTRDTLRSDVFLNYAGYGQADGPHTVDYFLWAVVGNAGVTLIDTGYDPQVARRRDRRVLHDPVELLRDSLGIDAADVSDVIVTHCHYDHIGNVHRFPNAQVYISSAELDFVRGGMLDRRLCGHFTEKSEVEAIESIARAGRLRPIECEQEVALGITVIPVGGHTPGQLMVQVATTEGAVLLASDALHFLEELECDIPFISSMNVPDTYRAFDLIRSKLESGEISHLIPGHDAASLDAMTRVASDVGAIGIR